METTNLKLKFRIIERYRTQARFAVSCGKNDNWISRIIQQRQLPTPEEKSLIVLKLKIPPGDVDSFFKAK